MALPFLRNTMLGDLFYVGVFFGGYAYARRHSAGARGGTVHRIALISSPS